MFVLPTLLEIYEPCEPLLKLDRKCHKENFVDFCENVLILPLLCGKICTVILFQYEFLKFVFESLVDLFLLRSPMCSWHYPISLSKFSWSPQHNYLLAQGVLTQVQRLRFANKPLYYWPFRKWPAQSLTQSSMGGF